MLEDSLVDAVGLAAEPRREAPGTSALIDQEESKPARR